MPTNPARENRILNGVILELEKIGTPPEDWLTTPSVALGIPGTALPDLVKQQLYLSPLTGDPESEKDDLSSAGPLGHQEVFSMGVWCISGNVNGITDALNLMADVRRALWAAEGTFALLTDGFGIWVDPFSLQLKMSRAGFIVILQRIHASLTLAHGDP